MTRPARSSSSEVTAKCLRCPSKWSGPTAMMMAARHTSHTHHQTEAVQVLTVTFGRCEAEEAQGALF